MDKNGMYEYIYEGVDAEVKSDVFAVTMRKYKNESYVYIDGVSANDADSGKVDLLKKLANKIFKVSAIKLLSDEGYKLM